MPLAFNSFDVVLFVCTTCSVRIAQQLFAKDLKNLTWPTFDPALIVQDDERMQCK